MLMLLSPAKTLDFSPTPLPEFTTPRQMDQTEMLVRKMRRYSAASLMKLMDISDKLAELNKERYEAFATPFSPQNAKQALLAFKGDSYTGFELDDYSEEDWAFAQGHLRILSGLYGVLRPLDLIQPYRLEMGTRLKTRRGDKLTDFWGDRITRALNADLAGHGGSQTVLNLASNEYFASVAPKALEGPVVDVAFRDFKGGKYKVISFFAKRARGAMANWVIRNRIDAVDEVKAFDVDGYRFAPDASSEAELVFLRKA